jgi:hypothetical protein
VIDGFSRNVRDACPRPRSSGSPAEQGGRPSAGVGGDRRADRCGLANEGIRQFLSSLLTVGATATTTSRRGWCFPLVNYLPVAPLYEPRCQLVNHVALVQLDSVDAASGEPRAKAERLSDQCCRHRPALERMPMRPGAAMLARCSSTSRSRGVNESSGYQTGRSALDGAVSVAVIDNPREGITAAQYSCPRSTASAA